MRFAPRGWLGRHGLTVVSLDDGDSRLVYCGRHFVVQVFPARRYRAWWVPGFALTVRVGRVQGQWL